jgi:hypothetical protein
MPAEIRYVSEKVTRMQDMRFRWTKEWSRDMRFRSITERVSQTPIPNDAVDVFAVGEKFDTVYPVKSL